MSDNPVKSPQLAARHYGAVASSTAIEGASPHRLVQILIDGALERLHHARAAMVQGRIEEKGRLIGSVLSIIEGLRSSLDMTKGGEIAQNLHSLYEYITRRLLEANLNNDEKVLMEVGGLLREIKSGWDSIPPDFHYKS